MERFEFRLYDSRAQFIRSEIENAKHEPAAKQKAGRWAKRCGGPVDLARSTDEPWADRYITTASPSDVHASGYRLERLD